MDFLQGKLAQNLTIVEVIPQLVGLCLVDDQAP